MCSSGATASAPREPLLQQIQLLHWSRRSSGFPGALISYAGAHGAEALWEQIQLLHWSTWSSGFPGALQLCWSTWSRGSLGADTVAPLEHMEQWLPWSTEQLCWSTWSSGSLGADTVPPLENMEQHLSGSRFSSSTAPCVPVKLLCVLWESSCSKKYLYLLPESRCSMGSSRAALCARGKLLLHNAPLEHLYLLLESRCSTCYSIAALCAPR